MKLILLFIFSVFLAAPGCQRFERQTPSAPETEIVASVKYALSLEKRLFENKSRFKSREQVYRHYRQGFGTEFAERLSEYSWMGGEMGLRPADSTMEPPGTVTVLRIDRDRAIVFYKTPRWQRDLWGRQEFTVLRLKSEEGRWVIVEAKGVNSPPTH